MCLAVFHNDLRIIGFSKLLTALQAFCVITGITVSWYSKTMAGCRPACACATLKERIGFVCLTVGNEKPPLIYLALNAAMFREFASTFQANRLAEVIRMALDFDLGNNALNSF